MAVGHLKIGKVNFTFVFRHRFETPDEAFDKWKYRSEFRNWELGVWFRPSKMVGSKEFKTISKWKYNMVRSYMVGINLLICKAWVDWNVGGMQIDIKE